MTPPPSTRGWITLAKGTPGFCACRRLVFPSLQDIEASGFCKPPSRPPGLFEPPHPGHWILEVEATEPLEWHAWPDPVTNEVKFWCHTVCLVEAYQALGIPHWHVPEPDPKNMFADASRCPGPRRYARFVDHPKIAPMTPMELETYKRRLWRRFLPKLLAEPD